MLTQTFKSILLMSAVGSVLSAFWLCLKPITRKLFSPSWQYYIWLTVLVVMILPVRFSVPSRTPDIPVASVNQVENVETEVPQTDSQAAEVQIPEQTEKISIPKIKLPQNIFYYLANIWLLGMLAILLAKIVKYNLFLRAIHKNSVIDTDISGIPKRLTVRKTDMLDAPLIVGSFKPTLLLPDTEIAENDMNYILMHELTHYRRNDILYKWFAMIVSSVHWFNPFVYVVSRQIDTECEVSCDFAVTSKLSDNEKNGYMSMILDLVANSKSSLRPLTTQMASEKRTIKRRFTMIRNKKVTGKFMSVISALMAVIMLSTTVFASGILTDLATDDYTIEILNNGEKIELANKPFIENGEVYVPLRETLEKAMSKDKGIVDIQWDNGTIDVIVAYYQGESGMYQFKIGGDFMKLQHISYEGYKNNSFEKSMIVTALSLKQSPVLKDTITYVTLKDVNYMLYGYTSRRDENNKLRELNYNAYDKKGEPVFSIEDNEKMLAAADTWAKALIDRNGLPRYEIMTEDMQKQFIAEQKRIAGENWNYVIGDSSPKTVGYDIDIYSDTAYITYLQADNTGEKYSIKEKITFEKSNGEFLVSAAEDIEYGSEAAATATKTSKYKNHTPQYIVDCFFYLFGNSDFESMKRYCTENCINTFFKDNRVFGMEKASLVSMDIAPTEYAKSSNDFNVFVSVSMKPHPESIYAPDDTSASFYVVLQRQNDGSYLIDGFSTGV